MQNLDKRTWTTPKDSEYLRMNEWRKWVQALLTQLSHYLKKTFVPNHGCLSGNERDKRSQKKAIGPSFGYKQISSCYKETNTTKMFQKVKNQKKISFQQLLLDYYQ